MKSVYRHVLEKAYTAFNSRNIEDVLKLMHPDVIWPNGWEGGYVEGRDGSDSGRN